MLLKNVSYETLAACTNDERDIAVFMPQQVIEVEDSVVEELLERYNRDGKVFLEKIALVAEDTPGFICDVCGQICASDLGLASHKRKHK